MMVEISNSIYPFVNTKSQNLDIISVNFSVCGLTRLIRLYSFKYCMLH